MIRALMVDVDSKDGFANLVLMKLAAFLREVNNGNIEIDLIRGIPETAPLFEYDKVYVSNIFFQNKEAVEEYVKQFPEHTVEVGGSGWNLKSALPDTIEHIRPDYSLYDIDYSMGFTSRGCIRNCQFCIVPEKEGRIYDHAPISEFLEPTHKKLVLLDNNFLASPKWKQNLEYANDLDLKINISQGLDIRLLDQERAAYLKDTKTYGWKFKGKKLHFAFDSLRYEKDVRKGVQLLKDAGYTKSFLKENALFYVLVGYDTTIKEDLERIEILLELGVSPFIMRYNKEAGEHRILLHLARWVNTKIFFSVKNFADYDDSDSLEAYRKTFGSDENEKQTRLEL